MLKNYLLIAWRNLTKHKLFSLINVFGLAIGMCVCLLILQYVHFELSFDKFHNNTDNIYRITHERYQEGQLVEKLSTTFPAMGRTMKREFPEVKEETSFIQLECIFSAADPQGSQVTYREPRVFIVDDSFLEIFNFPLKEGSAAAMSEPNSMIMTESAAKKYFGQGTAIGKTFRLRNHNQGMDLIATVRGVCKDIPPNSHIKFDFLVSKKRGPGSWSYPDDFTYIVLAPGTSTAAVEAKMAALLEKHTNKAKTSASNIVLSLQPLKDVHLYSDFAGETEGGNGKLVWFLVLIAVLILFIAYVNYINLSTVKAIERAKEVGLRKVFGTLRRNLLQQFFFESLLLNLIAVLLAIGMALLAHNFFNQLTGVNVPYTFWTSYWFWLALAAAVVISAFISGFYPASFLSGYKPVQVLAGKLPISTKGVGIRKGLVVFQFTISIILMIVTFTIYRQVNYMRNSDLGMNMAQTVIVAAPDPELETKGDDAAFYQKLETFQTELVSNTGITGVTSSSSIPGQEIDWTRPYRNRVEDLGKQGNLYSTFSIGPEFIKQFGIKTLAGDNFAVNRSLNVDSAKPSPYTPIMVNEAAVKALGFPDNQSAIDQVIVDKNGSGRLFEYKITGVLQNFHQKSLKEAFTPIVFRLEDGSAIEYFSIKLNSKNISRVIGTIENKYKALFPSSPYEFFFLDEFFNQQYKQDQQFNKIFGLFAGFAIFVGCLGLLGLSLFTSMQKIKEIGIRKVLGASSVSILVLILKDFIKLIAISALVAWPISWLAMHFWLQNYQFRISITPWLFLLPIFLVLVVAVITVSAQAWKACVVNPVKSIRHE